MIFFIVTLSGRYPFLPKYSKLQCKCCNGCFEGFSRKSLKKSDSVFVGFRVSSLKMSWHETGGCFGSCQEKSAPRSCPLWRMLFRVKKNRLTLDDDWLSQGQIVIGTLSNQSISEDGTVDGRHRKKPTNMNESLSIMGYWINRIKPIVFWYDCMTESGQKWWHDDVTKLIWRFFCAYKGNTRLDFTFFQDFYI